MISHRCFFVAKALPSSGRLVSCWSTRGVATRRFCTMVCAARRGTASRDEVWKSWQCGGLSMDDVAVKYSTSKDVVFQHLVAAVEAGKPIDWAAMCRELGLTGSIASEVYKVLPRTSDEKPKVTPGVIKRLTNAEISKEQIRLCVLMLERGFSVEDIKAVVCLEPGYFASETERLNILCKELQASRKIKKEFFRASQGKKVVLDQGLIDLLRDRKEASLVEIAGFFSDCDPKQLVDLLYELEKSGNICVSQGKYKVVNTVLY